MRSLAILSLVLGATLACDATISCNDCTEALKQQGKCTCNPDGTCQATIAGNYVMYPFSDIDANSTINTYSSGKWKVFGTIRNFLTARFTSVTPYTSPMLSNKCAPESITDIVHYWAENNGDFTASGVSVLFYTYDNKYVTSSNGENVAMKANSGTFVATERFTRYVESCTYGTATYNCLYFKASSGKYIWTDGNGYWYPNKTNSADATRFYFAYSAEMPIKKFSTLDRYYKVTSTALGTGMSVTNSAVDPITYQYVFKFYAYDHQYFNIISEYNWKQVRYYDVNNGIYAGASQADNWFIDYPTAAHDYYTIKNRDYVKYWSFTGNLGSSTVGADEKFTPFPVQQV